MRFRLYPTAEQEVALREHCAHARFVWNLGLEQRNMYRPVYGHTPGFNEQCRQLAEARASNEWLRSGSNMVQQQAIRDLDGAFRKWWSDMSRTGHPTWRKRGEHEGFRVVGSPATR